jgi:hypothetical protein
MLEDSSPTSNARENGFEIGNTPRQLRARGLTDKDFEKFLAGRTPSSAK